MYKKLTSGVRRKMANGETPVCIMRSLLEGQAQYGFDDELVDYAAGTLFGECDAEKHGERVTIC